MGGGVLYANTNVIMQGDTYLLTRKRIREMAAAATREDLLKVLTECGYQTNLPNDATIIEAERQKTLKTFMELCEDEALSDCVQAMFRATESNFTPAFATIAAQAPHIKTKSIRQYFITLIDMVNVRTHYKGGKTWVSGGTLAPNQLHIFGDATPEAVEEQITARLDALGAIDKDDIFKPNPLFWWYLQKQKEFKAVKTILMCKRFNYEAAVIRANLRGLYEQFQ